MTIVVIANIIIVFSVCFLIWKNESSPLKVFFWPALSLKICAGISLGLVYTYYYSIGDTFEYHKDAIKLAGLAHDDLRGYVHFMWYTDTEHPIWSELGFQQPRAIFFAKVASLLSLICSGNYWIIASYLSLLCFISSWVLATLVAEYNNKAALPALFALHFFPSVVFWTSGLIKESLAMSSLYFITFTFLRLWMCRRVSIIEYMLLFLCVWIEWNLKYYYLAVLLPVLATSLVMRRWIIPKLHLKTRGVIIVSVIVFLIPLSVASVVHPNFYPERFLEVIVSNHDAFVALSSPNDFIEYSSLQPDVLSIMKNSPKALYSAVFRPSLWEATNAAQKLASIENLLIMLFFLSWLYTAIITRKKADPVVWPLLTYVVLLGIFLALSTPNFGTLSRYRVGFLPFFVLMICTDNAAINWLTAFAETKLRRVVE